MRINLEQGTNYCQLVYDTYTDNLAGLKDVLNFTAWQAFNHQKTLILADISQSDTPIDQLYDQVAALLYHHQIDRLVGIGPQLTKYAHKFTALETHLYKNISELLASQLLEQIHKNVLIIKQSNTYGVTQLVNRLQKKCHVTTLEIDLGAIEHNLNFLRSQLSKDTGIIAMVKAAAYGSSSFHVAHFLQQWQVDYLAVAYADEGETLRKQGIRLPIMVMNPAPACFERLLAYQLEPVIYSIEILQHWHQFAQEKAIHTPIHIKLDTGMHRLGFMGKDIEELIYILQRMPYVTVKSVCSHLAASGNQQHDDYTHKQARLFQHLANYIENRLGISVFKHLLNTAGTQYHPIYEFDMVRLGIGLYGFSKKIQHHLKPAHTLKTTISQIKEVPAGATIGYERKGIAEKPTTIAILPIGYADGFRHTLSNGRGKVWVNGKLAPVIGNVCMDMTMVDITGIEAKEGDEVIIFGKTLPITEICSATGAIVYEILTNISERVKRIYYKELSDSSQRGV